MYVEDGGRGWGLICAGREPGISNQTKKVAIKGPHASRTVLRGVGICIKNKAMTL